MPAFLFGCTAGECSPATVADFLLLPRMWFFGDSILQRLCAICTGNLKLTTQVVALEMPKGRNVKKILLTTTALIALGIVPAAAADLAARPYTKAPPMAVAYNWSGVYAGVYGGRGASGHPLGGSPTPLTF